MACDSKNKSNTKKHPRNKSYPISEVLRIGIPHSFYNIVTVHSMPSNIILQHLHEEFKSPVILAGQEIMAKVWIQL